MEIKRKESDYVRRRLPENNGGISKEDYKEHLNDAYTKKIEKRNVQDFAKRLQQLLENVKSEMKLTKEEEYYIDKSISKTKDSNIEATLIEYILDVSKEGKDRFSFEKLSQHLKEL